MIEMDDVRTGNRLEVCVAPFIFKLRFIWVFRWRMLTRSASNRIRTAFLTPSMCHCLCVNTTDHGSHHHPMSSWFRTMSRLHRHVDNFHWITGSLSLHHKCSVNVTCTFAFYSRVTPNQVSPSTQPLGSTWEPSNCHNASVVDVVMGDAVGRLHHFRKSLELSASLQNCWQVPALCLLLTDTTLNSTCQTFLTSPYSTRGTGCSMSLAKVWKATNNS